MKTPFDYMVLSFLLLLGLSGFIKGFLATILGPLNLTLSLFTAWIVFQFTKNLPLTILIGLFCPVLLGILMRILQSLLIRDTSARLPLWSKTTGSLLGVVWGVACVIGFLWAYGFLPYVPETAQQVITTSVTYQIYTQNVPFHETAQSTSQEEKNQIFQNFLQNNIFIKTLQDKNLIQIPVTPSEHNRQNSSPLQDETPDQF